MEAKFAMTPNSDDDTLTTTQTTIARFAATATMTGAAFKFMMSYTCAMQALTCKAVYPLFFHKHHWVWGLDLNMPAAEAHM